MEYAISFTGLAEYLKSDLAERFLAKGEESKRPRCGLKRDESPMRQEVVQAAAQLNDPDEWRR